MGPVPAEPSMSAFAFPLAEPNSAVRQSSPLGHPPPPSGSGPKPLPQMNVQTTPQPLVANRPPPPVNINKPIPAPAPAPMPPPQLQQPVTAPTAVMMKPVTPLQTVGGFGARGSDDEDATTVGAVPQEVLARASGEGYNPEELEWPTVFEEFVKTKKQCGEPTEGLTLEKFKQTLRKNRDALVQRHNCKRVKFTVYVKDGRASLKATPIKD